MIAAVVAAVIAASCATTANSNYTLPQAGSINNAPIAVKDYQSLGVIFVQSTEIIDGNGNHSGSKITYEMLMREAIKLGADDVINIKIDVNEVQELVPSANGGKVLRTTYNYTANALAIKYTNAVIGGVSGSRSGSALAESPPVQGSAKKSDSPFNLDDKNVFAVSLTGAYGAGWTAGGTVTVYEKHKPGAFIVPSFFITSKYLEDPSDSDDSHYWHPSLYTGGVGVLLKLKPSERFNINFGVSVEYMGGSIDHYNDHWDHGGSHDKEYSAGAAGIQIGVSYRLTPNISLGLNGIGKFAFTEPVKCERNGHDFGDYNIAMGGAELAVTFMLPY